MGERAQDEIIVVTGLPRSGTSMMMRMLAAGGVTLLVDDLRAADDNNPLGYFEFTPVKRLKESAAWVPMARGKAVKVVSYLLPHLPLDEQYRVLFLEREPGEVAASQERMLGKAATTLSDELREMMARQNAHARAWIARAGCPSLTLRFAEAHATPRATAEKVAAFLGGGVDVGAMAGSVDAALYRNRLK